MSIRLGIQSESESKINIPPLSPPSAHLPFDVQPTFFIKLPTTTPQAFPRLSSPLGPCRYSLPGWPVFPPSVRKLDLYRRALKKSARQAKIMHIKTWKKSISGGSAGKKDSDLFELLVVWYDCIYNLVGFHILQIVEFILPTFFWRNRMNSTSVTYQCKSYCSKWLLN
jgi:hypothetical protein